MKKIILFIMIFFNLFYLVGCNQDNYVSKYDEALEKFKNMDFKNAEIICNEIKATDKNYKKSLFLKSKIMFSTGRKKESMKLQEKIIKKNPYYIDAHLFLIRSLIETGNYEMAQKHLEKVLEYNSNDFRVFYLYSILAKKNQDLKGRLFFQKKAEDCIKEGCYIYFDLASVYNEFGLSDKADKYIEKAEVIFNQNFNSNIDDDSTKEK